MLQQNLLALHLIRIQGLKSTFFTPIKFTSKWDEETKGSNSKFSIMRRVENQFKSK